MQSRKQNNLSLHECLDDACIIEISFYVNRSVMHLLLFAFLISVIGRVLSPRLNGKSGNKGLFDFCSLIQISFHLYVKVHLTLLMHCGADGVTAEFECFYSNSELVTLAELQFTECREMDSAVACGESGLFSARRL